MSVPNGHTQFHQTNRITAANSMNDKKRQFFEAIRDGNVQKVRRILQEGDINANTVFWHNETKNSGQNQPNQRITHGKEGNDYVDVQFKCSGDTPLHQAAEKGQEEICRILIRDWKAEVNIKNPSGNTALHCAALHCHPAVCQVLLKEGKANANLKNDLGESPIHLAAITGAEEVCRVLIKDGNADVDLKNKVGNTPLHKAVDGNHPGVCKILIKEGNANVNLQNQWGTPLHRAAGQNHTEICKILIEDGNADVNIRNRSGDTPLHKTASEKRPEACKILIEDGDAKVNRWNKGRDTPLHTAAEQNCEEVCELLIQLGKANVNIKNIGGNTPLHYAARRNHAKVAKVLLEQGDAEIDIKNREGHTALDYKFKGKKNAEIIQHALKIYSQNVTNHRLMEGGEQHVERVKLFMVGNPKAGKTTLMNSMSKVGSKEFLSSLFSKESDSYCPTPGIRVKFKKIRGAGEFVIWDMAGQVEFHVTHAMFLGKSKGIFIIAYDISTTDSHMPEAAYDVSTNDSHMEELMYWLRFLKAGHSPNETKPKVVIVGTHLDKINNIEFAKRKAQSTVDGLIEQFGEVLDIHTKAVLLDARKRSGEELDILKETLNKLAEPMRGDRIPRICEEISKQMSSWCTSDLPLLTWTHFADKVREIDPLAKEDFIKRAVGYLHDTGKLFHAQVADHDDILILDADWLASKIFCPIFAKHDFKVDHPGLKKQKEYTLKDLTDHFNVKVSELLVTLLQHFELAYCHTRTCRSDMKTFIIPAKLPPGVQEIDWEADPTYFRYTGFRIECQDITDMFAADAFSCIQVCMMNRYQPECKTPILSHFGLKVVDQVEGMLQLTEDKRAIHIAVREKQGIHQDAAKQLLEMKQIVLDELKQRSMGTKIKIFHLSPKALSLIRDLVTNVHYFSEQEVQEAEENHKPLVDPKLNQESVASVKGCLAAKERNSQVDNVVCSTSVLTFQSTNVPHHNPHHLRLQHQQENHLSYLSTTNQSIPKQPMYMKETIPVHQQQSTIPDNANQANRQTRLVPYFSSQHGVAQAAVFNRQMSLPISSTFTRQITQYHHQQNTPLLQNLLVDSFHPLVTDRQHLFQDKCGPRCGWNCIPLDIRQQVYLLIDAIYPDPLGRDQRAMAEVFGVPEEIVSQMKNFHARDPSLTATLIKVVFMYRTHQGGQLSIEEVLTVIKHPGVVGHDDAAKLIEDFLAKIGHHGPHEAYKLKFGVPDEVLLHRAILKKTRDHIRQHIRPSDIAVYLEGHLTLDDINEIRMCEDDKTYNYPKAADLLLYKLMQLRDTEWYQTLVDVIESELNLTLTKRFLVQEREKLLLHPFFSKLSITDETKDVKEPEVSNPTVDINDIFRTYSPPVPPPKMSYENPAFESDS